MFSCCRKTKKIKMRQNSRFEYLVIIKETDLTKCWGLKYKSIKNKCADLNGIVHYAINNQDVCLCHNHNYIIHGMTKENTLYVKLPKEKIYTEQLKWEIEYEKSQLLELIYIFRKLGALELNISVKNIVSNTFSLAGELGLNVYGTDVSMGISRLEDQLCEDNIITKLKFNSNSTDKYNSLQELLDDPKLYYYITKFDWQNFVSNRLEGNATDINFEFIYENTLSISNSAQLKLNKIGISMAHNNKNHVNKQISFSAIF